MKTNVKRPYADLLRKKMARTHTEVVSVRMTPAMASILTEVAQTHGLKTLAGSPNLGAAARMLIAAGLDLGNDILINEELKNNVRSEILQVVNNHTMLFIAALTKDLR